MADTFSALQHSAVLYQAAARVLYSSANARWLEAKKSGSPLPVDSTEFNEMLGGISGSIVLHAFAVELALKAVCVKRGLAYPKSHDLGHLFSLLPPADQATAESSWKQKNQTSGVSFREVLESNANAFEEWRYQHEYGPTNIVSEELSLAFEQIYTLSNAP